MRFANKIAALLTIALGAFMVWEAGRMHVGFGGGLHPGVFPKILGSGLVIIGVLQFGAELSARFATAGDVAWPRGRDGARVILVLAAVVAYMVAIEYLGFALDTFLLVLFLVSLLGNFGWLARLAAAIITTGCSTLVFKYWLDLKLPGGFLGM